MKRLILFVIVLATMSSCICTLSQIPPQKIYAGAGCTAPLPDFRLKISASDNCEITSLTQTPAPGFLLTATNKIATVVVKASDASNNSRQVSFTVTLIDTVKPVLTVDTSLMSLQYKQINEVYNHADRLVEYMEDNFSLTFPWDSFPPVLRTMTDQQFHKRMLVVASIADSLGIRHRVITYADTLKLPMERNPEL